MAKPATMRPTSIHTKLFAPLCIAHPQRAISAPSFMETKRRFQDWYSEVKLECTPGYCAFSRNDRSSYESSLGIYNQGEIHYVHTSRRAYTQRNSHLQNVEFVGARQRIATELHTGERRNNSSRETVIVSWVVHKTLEVRECDN